jgi:hypothetical protein
MRTDFAVQSNLAKVKAGDWLYTSPTPTKGAEPGLFFVTLENPNVEPGKARQVVDNVSVKGVGRHLIFHDATRTVSRNGTSAAYVFKLDADGQPLPVPQYPVCPTCGADRDNPSCHTKSGTWTSMHKAREKLLRLGVNPEPGARTADVVDASIVAATTEDQHGKRVHRDPDGTVWIEGWTGGEGEHTTPEGWRVHVTSTGIVTVLGQAAKTTVSKGATPVPVELHATDAEADAKLAAAPPATDGDRCHTCKGYGLVRKRGPRAGEKYKTYNGALQAKAGGNAVKCPTCSGAGLVAA